jgi:hypothetical protein
MFVDVPAPACIYFSGKSSSFLFLRRESAASMIFDPISFGIFPPSVNAFTYDLLMIIRLSIILLSMNLLYGKFESARAVSGPYNRSSGISTSPSESLSFLVIRLNKFRIFNRCSTEN